MSPCHAKSVLTMTDTNQCELGVHRGIKFPLNTQVLAITETDGLTLTDHGMSDSVGFIGLTCLNKIASKVMLEEIHGHTHRRAQQ